MFGGLLSAIGILKIFIELYISICLTQTSFEVHVRHSLVGNKVYVRHSLVGNKV